MTAPSSSVCIIDRTQLFLPDNRVKIHTPIGRPTNPKSIEDLFHDRVFDIIKKAEHRRIVITWSGGIDSTAVLVAFLMHADHKQLIVLLNEYSIEENPEFYKTYIDGLLETGYLDFFKLNAFSEYIDTSVIVTGVCFDEIFGDPLYIALTETDLRVTKTEFAKFKTWEPLLKLCPVELKDVRDILWWKNYSLDYQYDQMNWCLYDERLRLEHNLFHFCDAEDWNDYAVSTPSDVKWGNSYQLNRYKEPLKQFIKDFSGDSEYYINKTKQVSMRKFRTQYQRNLLPAYIDQDWNRGYAI